MNINKALFLASLFAAAPYALAEEEHHAHFDIYPNWSGQNGEAIGTGGVTHATTVNLFTGEETLDSRRYVEFNVRVFGIEFGEEDAGFPHWANDPGLNSDAGMYYDAAGNTHSISGTGLPSGSTLYLTVTADLQYWNGSGFSPAPNGELLQIKRGSFASVAGTGTGLLAPLSVDASAQQVHTHLDSFIWGSEAELLAETTSTATEGIYLVTAKLQSSAGNVADSLPIFLVYNYGGEAFEEAHHEAIEWTNANLVPEPGVLSVIAFAAVGLMRRRAGDSGVGKTS